MHKEYLVHVAYKSNPKEYINVATMYGHPKQKYYSTEKEAKYAIEKAINNQDDDNPVIEWNILSRDVTEWDMISHKKRSHLMRA